MPVTKSLRRLGEREIPHAEEPKQATLWVTLSVSYTTCYAWVTLWVRLIKLCLLQCVSNSRVTLRVSDTASLCVSNARPISAQWHRFGRCKTKGGRGLSTEVIQATELHHLQQKLNSTNVNINFHKTRGFHVGFTASGRTCANMSIFKSLDWVALLMQKLWFWCIISSSSCAANIFLN